MKRLSTWVFVLFAVLVTLSSKNSMAKSKTIFDFATEGNLSALAQIVEADEEAVSSIDENGRSALFLAAANDHVAVVHYLLTKKSDPNLLAGDSWRGSSSPLHEAAKNGYAEVLKELIAFGGNPNLQAKWGSFQTPLHWAAQLSQLNAVQVLLDAGADVNRKALDGTSESGMPAALEFAAASGSDEIARLLIARGADIHNVSREFGSPLNAAACRGRKPELTLSLIEMGASISAVQHDYSGNLGKSTFWCAVSYGMRGVVPALIARGADVNETDARGATPLGMAAAAGDVPLMRVLLKAGALVNPDGAAPVSTPLIQAVNLRNLDGIRELLAQGALPNQMVKEGMAALHFAAGSTLEIMEALIQGGANVEISAQDGSRPLHEVVKIASNCYWTGDLARKVCFRRLVRMIDLLKARGANLESRDNEGATPLWWVVKTSVRKYEAIRESVDMASHLLKIGADPNAKSNDGQTPKEIALNDGYSEMRELFESIGGRE